MADFPLLRTGAVTQYPSTASVRQDTHVLRFVDGSEQRWPQAGTTQRSWTLNLARVTEEELAAVEEFFAAQQGRFGAFAFRDPFDGVVYENCSFDADSLRCHLFDEESAQSSLIIRTNP
ncbi:MAG: DUF2460 domain-containing protein [Bryobacteraceae bacterium]|nr:DUF2460 domain-containing protein [Bryobacteraceae bacterium]